MRILITGKGTSGSWHIRGRQLGAAMGVGVIPKCEDFRAYDLVVVVKRITPNMLEALKGRPWVWDIVDAWPQPAGNTWSKTEAVKWLRNELASLKPSAVVFPTTAMAVDSGWEGPSLVLPHHAWPKYAPKLVRGQVFIVGYEGGPHYLGYWHKVLDEECNKRGWVFSLNDDLSGCDIGIALRAYDGYPAKYWKSNCKLANLQALGVPAICSPEQSYVEFGSGTEVFITSPEQLGDVFNQLMDYNKRNLISQAMQKATPRLDKVAKDYLQWLTQLSF